MYRDINIVHFPPETSGEANLTALREEIDLLREELSTLTANSTPEASDL